MSRWFEALSVSLAAVAISSAPALAAPQMELGARVAPPRGYIDFCAREPKECPATLRSQPEANARGVAGASMRNYWRFVFEAVEPAALPQHHAGGWPDRGEAEAEVMNRATAPGPLSLTPALWGELNDVNQSINTQIAPRSDIDLYGRSDYWALPLEGRVHAGDCEDYVLEKRRALRERGYPDNLLSIALVVTRWGENHAVLLVQTEQGELVLDSLTSRIVAWSEAGYRLVSRQSPRDPAIWVAGVERRASR